MGKIAIVQPYFIPYLGYFQLVNAVDTFVFYDDVQFIKGGHINRNYLKNEIRLTIPVNKKNVQSMLKICEVKVNWESNLKDKLIKTVTQLYSKSSNKKVVLGLLCSILDRKQETISELAIDSVKTFSEYMGIKTKFLKSSDLEYHKTNDRALNLMDICKSQSCYHYINPIGGKKLYDKDSFEANNIKLNFIKTTPGTSIIDICMDAPRKSFNKILNNYELI